VVQVKISIMPHDHGLGGEDPEVATTRGVANGALQYSRRWRNLAEMLCWRYGLRRLPLAHSQPQQNPQTQNIPQWKGIRRGGHRTQEGGMDEWRGTHLWGMGRGQILLEVCGVIGGVVKHMFQLL